MKSTGMVRKIDNLGRLVLPVEIRDSLNIKEGDLLAISLMDNHIVLSKCYNQCIFCDSKDNLKFFKNKPICNHCLADLDVTKKI